MGSCHWSHSCSARNRRAGLAIREGTAAPAALPEPATRCWSSDPSQVRTAAPARCWPEWEVPLGHSLGHDPSFSCACQGISAPPLAAAGAPLDRVPLVTRWSVYICWEEWPGLAFSQEDFHKIQKQLCLLHLQINCSSDGETAKSDDSFKITEETNITGRNKTQQLRPLQLNSNTNIQKQYTAGRYSVKYHPALQTRLRIITYIINAI